MTFLMVLAVTVAACLALRTPLHKWPVAFYVLAVAADVAYVIGVEGLLPRVVMGPLTLLMGKCVLSLALFVVVTGVFGMAIGDVLFLRLSIREGMAKGAGFGAASHGAGTARSYELGQQEGVVASLVMMLSGVLMVLVSPLVARMMF